MKSHHQKCLKYLQKECLHITQLIVKLYNFAFYVFVKFRAEKIPPNATNVLSQFVVSLPAVTEV